MGQPVKRINIKNKEIQNKINSLNEHKS